MSRRIDLSLILLLFVAHLTLTIAIVTHYQFDGLYGQDPFAYYNFADSMRTSIANQQALPAFFWPLGYPTVLALGFTFTGTQASTALGINLIMGAMLPALVYVLMRQIGAKPLFALLSGVLMLLCGQAIQSSIVIMADIPALFWGTLSAVILVHYTKTLQTRWLLLSAFILAFASITRWLYLILALPYAVVVFSTWNWRLNIKQILLCVLVTLPVFIPQLIYSKTTPYPTFNHAWVEGWNISNAFAHEFVNVDGHFNYEMVNGLFYAQPFYDAYYLAPVFTPFILIGLWWLVYRKQFKWLVLVIGWMILPYLFLIGIPYQNIRFPLIVVPAVVMCVGLGFKAVYDWTQSMPKMRYLSIALIVMIVAVGTWQTLGKAHPMIATFIQNQQRDKAVAYWLSDWIPTDSTLYTFGVTLTVQHYNPSFEVREIYYETPETLENQWIPEQTDYLLLNLWQIENQWAGREPQIAYYWLRDERGLTQLARYGNYTLFRIDG